MGYSTPHVGLHNKQLSVQNYITFSPRNIHVLCESTHDKNNCSKKHIDMRINRTKKCPLCVKALKVLHDKVKVHKYYELDVVKVLQ